MTKHQEAEYKLICETLTKFNGNRTLTAKELGISLRTVRNKIREMGQYGYDVPESSHFWISRLRSHDTEIAKKAFASLKKNVSF